MGHVAQSQQQIRFSPFEFRAPLPLPCSLALCGGKHTLRTPTPLLQAGPRALSDYSRSPPGLGKKPLIRQTARPLQSSKFFGDVRPTPPPVGAHAPFAPRARLSKSPFSSMPADDTLHRSSSALSSRMPIPRSSASDRCGKGGAPAVAPAPRLGLAPPAGTPTAEPPCPPAGAATAPYRPRPKRSMGLSALFLPPSPCNGTTSADRNHWPKPTTLSTSITTIPPPALGPAPPAAPAPEYPRASDPPRPTTEPPTSPSARSPVESPPAVSASPLPALRPLAPSWPAESAGSILTPRDAGAPSSAAAAAAPTRHASTPQQATSPSTTK
mmetsp:Transcript_10214/g.33664  ORF Transcript_10214/g.33664 Transcript_10214/m.33664 type:complete len:326 (-) Transcript_10214:1166-2143(-)